MGYSSNRKSNVRLATASQTLHASPNDFSARDLGLAKVKEGVVESPPKIPPQFSPNKKDAIVFRNPAESVDFEPSVPTNDRVISFESTLGISKNEPSIIFTSEFLPISGSEGLTQQGKSIQLKCDAKVINAKTALKLMLDVNNAKVLETVKANKEDLKNFMNGQESFELACTNVVSDVISSMDVFQSEEDSKSFVKILTDAGYSSADVNIFSQTKLWQQSLMEVKRTLMSHSPGLLGKKPIRKISAEDSDSYTLSEYGKIETGTPRFWINPAAVLPVPLGFGTTSNINEHLQTMLSYSKSQFVDINRVNSSDSQLTSFLPSSTLDSYSSTGRDISIIANILFKEALCCSSMADQVISRSITDNYGYSISSTGDNFRIWDYLVGRFTRSSVEVPDSPTGNGNSLVSLSSTNVVSGIGQYKVLTFENQRISNSDVTPGIYYYIDSAFNTVDGKSFDLTRLKDLIVKTKNAHETIKMISRFIGYELDTTSGQFRKKEDSRSWTSLSYISDKFSSLVQMYKDWIDWDARINENPVQDFGTFSSKDLTDTSTLQFKTDVIKDSSHELLLNTRLASLICKLTILPTEKFKISGKHEELKVLLFMWMMNIVLQRVEKADTSATISALKESISKILLESPTDISDEEYEAAINEGRTYNVSVDSTEKFENNNQNKDIITNINKAKATVLWNAVVFELDHKSGLWKIISDLMTTVYSDSKLFVNNRTAYSGISKTAYLYAFFDLLLRIIAVQTPENFQGTYTKAVKTLQQSTMEFDPTTGVITGGFTPAVTVTDTGFYISKVTSEQLISFTASSLFVYSNLPSKIITVLSSAISHLESESEEVVTTVSKYRNFIAKMNYSLNEFHHFMDKNFEKHLNFVSSVYDSEVALESEQKNALINISFSEGQMTLSRYIMSEIFDRMSMSTDVESRLKSLPEYSTFPDKFTELLNINDVEFSSFRLLSSYFKNLIFLNSKGNNKKIMSIGLPVGMIKNLRPSIRTSVSSNKWIRENVIRLKVYKLDRLRPSIIYLPQIYLFEMNRFPTRISSNWNFETFNSNSSNILELPMKLYTSNGSFILSKDYSDAFKQEIYGNFLNQEERYQIYKNHSESFIAEEYVRWFTDCQFDETRYNNYKNLSNDLVGGVLGRQYQSYVESISGMSRTTDISSNPSESISVKSSLINGKVEVNLYDPKNPKKQYVVDYGQPAGMKSNKSYTVPMNKTVKSYLQNETFLMDPSYYKKKIVYPKKFDRVFNLIIDPDDFTVDSNHTENSAILAYKNTGELIDQKEFGRANLYRNRDTGPGDISLEEYFVTIEPYDYVQKEQT